MIVGGNIDGFTRVMTTAIALETSKGDLPLAMALGAVLLLVVLGLACADGAVGPLARKRRRDPRPWRGWRHDGADAIEGGRCALRPHRGAVTD